MELKVLEKAIHEHNYWLALGNVGCALINHWKKQISRMNKWYSEEEWCFEVYIITNTSHDV